MAIPPRLNPCFSGTYSRRGEVVDTVKSCPVLILVLVEHTLGGAINEAYFWGPNVLILVLVEHTLGV